MAAPQIVVTICATLAKEVWRGRCLLSSEVEGLCQVLHRNQRWNHLIHTAGSCLHPTAKPKLLRALNNILDREDCCQHVRFIISVYSRGHQTSFGSFQLCTAPDMRRGLQTLIYKAEILCVHPGHDCRDGHRSLAEFPVFFAAPWLLRVLIPSRNLTFTA